MATAVVQEVPHEYLGVALFALVVGLAASCENEKSAGDNVIDVSPSYAELKKGASVTLTAASARLPAASSLSFQTFLTMAVVVSGV